MHAIVFIVYPGFELLDVSGPASVFQGANRALSQAGRPAFYRVGLASALGGLVPSSCGLAVHTEPLAEHMEPLAGHTEPLAGRAPAPDTLLVAGAEREPLGAALRDAVLLAALQPLAASVQRLGSVCSGSLVLAALGLLDGHRVATHWDACQPLARAFPQVRVDPESLYVVDGRLWTSAGVTMGIDMALAMVAHDLDAQIAGDVAQRLVLYARRPGYQSQFSPVLQAQIQAGHPFADLIAWIDAHLDAPLDVGALAERAHMTERTFHRKFVSATGETPARFVETVRLDAARMLLAQGLAVKAVATRVGLFPTSRLSLAFQRRFGVSPALFQALHGTPP
ncbi:AraC family transcriptional regulator [Comamonas serinivorans]|uniref:AraC family transcriptional regulator n=1 Tax=Comamonas serinivorans TaxID=1082851 RepID=A0A1Y0EN97_9BURK|nr:helix-turn-helix domain-containing protein [Comamonas serinivorans]ARU04782.1 AraC family transcriptional regulator [Comamonas serinivorans]